MQHTPRLPMIALFLGFVAAAAWLPHSATGASAGVVRDACTAACPCDAEEARRAADQAMPEAAGAATHAEDRDSTPCPPDCPECRCSASQALAALPAMPVHRSHDAPRRAWCDWTARAVEAPGPAVFHPPRRRV